MRVLNLWQKNGVFKIEVIQPLLDMAAGSSSGAAPLAGTDGPGRFCQVYYFSLELMFSCVEQHFAQQLKQSCLLRFLPQVPRHLLPKSQLLQ